MNAYVYTDTPIVILGIAKNNISEYYTMVYPYPTNGREIT